MSGEIHVFVIWANARFKTQHILRILESHFTIRGRVIVSWSADLFSSNLSRFYGADLPEGSDKSDHCGTGPFEVVIVVDGNPLYEVRDTSKGPRNVNVATFDTKVKLRQLTGGGHRVHASDTSTEAERDLWLLLKKAPKDFSRRTGNIHDASEFAIDLPGARGWSSLSELFDTLNRVSRYVVLRNFEEIPERNYKESHEDVDLLVEDAIDVAWLINGEAAHQDKRRAQYRVTIANEAILFDLRSVGDGYYCPAWSRRLLSGRVLERDCFYVPSNEDLFYSLLFHALIHKPALSDDYLIKISRLGGQIGRSSMAAEELPAVLASYLRRNQYTIQRPTDPSVYFNEEATSSLLKLGATPHFATFFAPQELLQRIDLRSVLRDFLIKEKLIEDSTQIAIDSLPRNPDRRDFRRVNCFRVALNGTARYHLTVGSDLKELWTRISEFAAACPSITCDPVALIRCDPFEALLADYFDGQNLQEVVANGMSFDKAAKAIQTVVDALEGTFEPSTISEASDELERLLAWVLKSEIFGSLDCAFIDVVILPLIRTGLLTQPPMTRWTNGDLIPQNILVNDSGDVRLIDYEFARKTHFYSEDAWRWDIFSSLPQKLRHLPLRGASTSKQPWSEALFALRQMALAHKVNGAAAALADANFYRNKVLEAAGGQRNHNLFFTVSETNNEQLEKGELVAQWFWSGNGDYSEAQSFRMPIVPDKLQKLQTQLPPMQGTLCLRFDPANRAGAIAIKNIRILDLEKQSTLLELTSETKWTSLRFGGAVICFAGSMELNLFALDDDPVIVLPELDLNSAQRILVLQVEMLYSNRMDQICEWSALRHLPVATDLSEIANLRSSLEEFKLLAAANERVAAIKDLEATQLQGQLRDELETRLKLEKLCSELDQTAGALRDALEKNAKRVVDLTAEIRGLRELETNNAICLARKEEALSAAIANSESLQSQRIESQEKLAALNVSLKEIQLELLEESEKYSKVVESLHAQNEALVEVEDRIQLAVGALRDYPERLAVAEHWLGQLRNRKLVRLSLAIHNEKWPL